MASIIEVVLLQVVFKDRLHCIGPATLKSFIVINDPIKYDNCLQVICYNNIHHHVLRECSSKIVYLLPFNKVPSLTLEESLSLFTGIMRYS